MLIRAWKPWELSTGPRTVEGKARTARNGFKGGQWRELHELTKSLNALLREQRKGCDGLLGDGSVHGAARPRQRDDGAAEWRLAEVIPSLSCKRGL